MHFSHSGQLFLCGGLLLAAAGLSAIWIREDLRRGVACWELWERPRLHEAPELFWIAIARQVGRALLLVVYGFALIGWGLLV